MNCIVCNQPIIGRRSDSKYCSVSCQNEARKKRVAEKYFNELNGIYPENGISSQNQQQMMNASEELRALERENFNTILNLRTEYEGKIRVLEDTNLRQSFKIEKLEDKISELKENHLKELEQAEKSTTKDTVTAITQMPAVQTTLGMLANNLIPQSSSSLGSVENEFNIQERQIIDAIRRMQPDAQAYLGQMLYVLFSKTHQEQMQIFTTLQAYLSQEQQEEEDI
ncbi:hypothetical protein [Marinifilum sp. D737]|uniref:hypothetical protein n=1 Tax=Marinifilum sp. D737 TaxID=2969628 RepID=UPI002272DC7D|nr:hypothetical protein [Marinifilum sp. D737]MCY1634862.1 hypothetical protein [Marinifilum sp. D737]